jgi:hypothetical protein
LEKLLEGRQHNAADAAKVKPHLHNRNADEGAFPAPPLRLMQAEHACGLCFLQNDRPTSTFNV